MKKLATRRKAPEYRSDVTLIVAFGKRTGWPVSFVFYNSSSPEDVGTLELLPKNWKYLSGQSFVIWWSWN
jgi:hypothetical protein